MLRQHLDEVIALVYDAGSGHRSWQLALESVRQCLDCWVVQIVGVDMRRNQLVFSYESDGASAAAVLDYARTYHRLDPHAAYVAGGGIGELLSFSEVFDTAYIDSSPFYQQFLIPYGSRHMHGAKLHEAGGQAIMLGLHRAVGCSPLQGEEWASAQRLCYHLTQAARIYAETRRVAMDGAVAREVIDRLASPVLLVDRYSNVVKHNAAAEALSASASPLSVTSDGMLRCEDKVADQAIARVLRSLTPDASQDAFNASPPGRSVLRVGGGRDKAAQHLLCVSVLRPERTLNAFGHSPLAMLVVHSLQAAPSLDPFLVASVFDLTPSEAMAASALARGESPKAIASNRGISLHTIQSHIRAIHAKLGVRKNHELVALLQSVAFGALPPEKPRIPPASECK